MDRKFWSQSIGAVLLAVLFSGCYTQVQTVERERIVYLPDDRQRTMEVGQERALNERVEAGRLVEDPNYLYPYEDGHEDGYEDGWTDAEAYYYIDYDARSWYDRHAVYGVRPVHITNVYHINSYPGSIYWGSPWMGYRPWHRRGYVHLNLAFGAGYHISDPWYGWHDWYGYGYGYTRYPFGYGGFADSYWTGFHHGYGFGIYQGGWSGPSREYAVRTSALNSNSPTRASRSRGSVSPSVEGRTTQMRNSAGTTRSVRSRGTARPTSDSALDRTERATNSRVDRRTRVSTPVTRPSSSERVESEPSSQRVRTPRTRQRSSQGTIQYRPSSNGSSAVQSRRPVRRETPTIRRSTPQTRSSTPKRSGSSRSSSQSSSGSSSNGRSR